MTRQEKEENYNLRIEEIENKLRNDLATVTFSNGKSEIQHLREMHQIGQSLIDSAQGRAREIQNELCKIAGPEISKRNRG